MLRYSGFTLIELIVVISIIAIVASVGVPLYNSFIKDNRLSSATVTLLGEFQYARSEAVKRNSQVTICASSNGSSCNSSDWEDGRLVFVDDGAGTPANAANGAVDSETILKAFGAASSGMTFTPTLFTTSGYIIFSGDGTVSDVGTLVICDDRSVPQAININMTGQARKAYDSDESVDGVVNNFSGVNVTCPSA